MDLSWFAVKQLMDPGIGLGAAGLAIVFIVIAWSTCAITTRLVKRASWVMGRLKRQISEEVVRYIMRIKNLLIFLIAGLFYASLVPGLMALMGTMVAGAGITALVVWWVSQRNQCWPI